MKVLALSLCCVLGLIACNSRPVSGGSQAQEIVIASDLPITGFEGDGPPLEQAIQLAVLQNPTIGPFKLTYWSLDDAVAGAVSLEKGIQNVDRLIRDHHVVGVIGPFTSPAAVAEIPLGNQASMVMIAPGTTSACLTRSQPRCFTQADELRPTGRNNFFRIAPPDPLQGAAMARYLAQRLQLRRAAAINEMGDLGKPYLDSFSQDFERLGGQLVLSEEMKSGTVDFTAFMERAKTMGTQAIFALGTADGQICTAAAQMPADMVFLGTDNFTTDQDCIAQAGNASSIFGTLTDVDATQLPQVPAAVSAYHKQFPKTKLSSDYLFAAYDCATILINAIRDAVDVNHGQFPRRDQVLDAVARTVYQGATGTYSFDANGDAKVPLMSMYQVKNGRWTFVQRIDVTGD